MRALTRYCLTLVSATALLAGVADVRANDAEQAATAVLEKRATRTCDRALQAWFDAERGVAAPAVRQALAQCYEALAQLHALGRPQPIIADGTRLPGLPAAWLAHKAGIRLDPYQPLAGQTLVMPKEDSQ